MAIISKVHVSHIVTTKATITWRTDSPSPSRIHYGPTGDYGQFYEELPLITDHNIQLSGLIKNQTYHFQILAENAYGETTTSDDYTFTTSTEDPFIALEENIIMADERVRNSWQKLITVLPDALNPQLDVMSGYLESVRKRMQPTAVLSATTAEDTSGTGALAEETLRPTKKG